MGKTAGLKMVENGAAPGLGAVRKRASHLHSRVEELRGKVQAARERDVELGAALQEKQEGLIEGTAEHEDVAAAESELERHRAATRHLEKALGEVEAELVPLQERVDQEDHARAVDRELAAVDPDLERAEKFLDAFVQNVVDLAEPLRERQALAHDVRERFSHIRGVEAVPLAEVAAMLAGKIGGDPQACLFYLRRVMAGPSPVGVRWQPVPPLADQVQQSLGVRDR